MKPERRRLLKIAAVLCGVSLTGTAVFTAWLAPRAPARIVAAVKNTLTGLFGGGDGATAGDRLAERSGGRSGNGAKGDNDPSGEGTAGGGDSSSLRKRGSEFDSAALPVGLTSADGAGGDGVHRAVRKNGVWFPVYSPGQWDGSGPLPLNVIPLSISSGSPPAGRVNEPWRYQAEAVGGTPPYEWSATLSAMPEAFLLDASSGLLTAQSAKPGTVTLTLAVTDAAGERDSAVMEIVFKPEKDLAILTDALPSAAPEQPFHATLEYEGGLPPVTWTHADALPGGLTLDAATGAISGTPLEAGEWEIAFTLTDSQKTSVSRTLRLVCSNGLEITTPAALPPATPGAPWRLDFKAEGGEPPYLWTLARGAFPDSSWQLSADGVLSGAAPAREGMAEFTLEVRDAADATFEKTFRLAVSDLLVAVPSREKAGLAWRREAVDALLQTTGGGAVGFILERNGVRIYEGTGDNLVDRGLTTGETFHYTLLAARADGTAQPVAEKTLTILPVTLERGVPGVRGDPYADRVTLFQPLSSNGYGATMVPGNVTGPPDGRGVFAPASKASEVLSLHAKPGAGGLIELEFTDNIVESGPGEDFTVFENVLFVGGDANNRFMEPATVSVALWPGEWRRFPVDVTPPAPGEPLNLRNPFYYRRGLAGRNGTTGDDPTNPARSGGDSFDLSDLPGATDLTWIRFIRIQSTGDNAMVDDFEGDPVRHNDDPAFGPLSGGGASGFDLDAVSAVNY